MQRGENKAIGIRTAEGFVILRGSQLSTKLVKS